MSDIIETGIFAGQPKNRTPATEATLSTLDKRIGEMQSRDKNLLVSSLRRAWRSEFPGPALNAERWQIISQGAGQSISFSGGELTINAGVMAGQEFILRTVSTVSIPFRAWFIARLSQRIANQEIRFEAINADGGMVAGWLIDGTTATQAKYYSANTGNLSTSAASTIATTANNLIFELEMFPDEFWAITRAVDSVAARTNPYCKTLNIPDPEDDYYLQIRVTNLAAPPASNTQVVIGAVAVQDINEITAEITGGRGDSTGAKAISVSGSLTSVPLSGSASIGSASATKVISAAGLNATVMKASLGSIYWMSLSNNSAAWRYVKIYNMSTAPVVGTNTPAFVIGIPPGTTIIQANAVGMRFSLGIAIAITAGIADTDTTAIGANEVVVSLNYT